MSGQLIHDMTTKFSFLDILNRKRPVFRAKRLIDTSTNSTCTPCTVSSPEPSQAPTIKINFQRELAAEINDNTPVLAPFQEDIKLEKRRIEQIFCQYKKVKTAFGYVEKNSIKLQNSTTVATEDFRLFQDQGIPIFEEIFDQESRDSLTDDEQEEISSSFLLFELESALNSA